MSDKINLQEFADQSDFKQLPKVTFGERASLTIAVWVLSILAGVLLLSFVVATVHVFRNQQQDSEKLIEFLKFLVQAVIPLATLAVGYYLGTDRKTNS